MKQLVLLKIFFIICYMVTGVTILNIRDSFARLSTNDREAVVLEAYYALSEGNRNYNTLREEERYGTSTNNIKGTYYGDWNYIADDIAAYEHVKNDSILQGYSSNWTADGCRPKIGCGDNCCYCIAGKDYDFYKNITGYGYANNVGRGGQCKYFAHLILYRAIGNANIETYDVMKNNSASIGAGADSVLPQRGDIIFRHPKDHTAIVVDVRKNDNGTLREVAVIESNYTDPDSGPSRWRCNENGKNSDDICETKPDCKNKPVGESNEAISKRKIPAEKAAAYRIWKGTTYYDEKYKQSFGKNLISIFSLLLSDTNRVSMNGIFYNREAQAGGTLDSSLAITDGDLKAYINFTEMPNDSRSLCGAGNLHSPVINSTVSGEFISHDNDDGCWFDDGGIFTITGSIFNTNHFTGSYDIHNANGSNFAEGGGVFDAWISGNMPQRATYQGTFTNTTYNRSGTIIIEISSGTNTVSGHINYTNLSGENPLCGAGEFTGAIDHADGSVEFSFISEDQDPGCGFEHGVRFIQNATITENIIEGTYCTGQHGNYYLERVF